MLNNKRHARVITNRQEIGTRGIFPWLDSWYKSIIGIKALEALSAILNAIKQQEHIQLRSRFTIPNHKSVEEQEELIFNKSRHLITKNQLKNLLINQIQESIQDLDKWESNYKIHNQAIENPKSRSRFQFAIMCRKKLRFRKKA